MIDVANGIADQPMDVAIRGDTIAAVEEPGVLPPSAAAEVFDASGLLVMPGLVDLHAHGFKGIGPVGIDFDEACLSRCTTTAMDAGSAGSATFPGFKEFIIDPCKTRVLSFLNISMIGLAGTLDGANTGGPGAGGSNQSLAYMSVEDTVRCIRENRDHVVGVKTLLSRPISDDGRTEAATYAMALEASGEAGVPLMCHHSMSSIPIEECPGHLRRGDIYTHCFHGFETTIMDSEARKVNSAVHEAHKRGVIMDIGHGAGSFNWTVAEQCWAEGLRPTTISTDIWTSTNVGPCYDLPTCMTKMLAVGMSLVRASHWLDGATAA